MKLLVFSDLHLGKKGFDSFFLSLDKKVIDVVCNESKKVDKIIFLGDFFHNMKEIDQKTLLLAKMLLDKLNSLNIPIVMILGNHSLFYKSTKEINYYRVFNGFYSNIKFVETILEDNDLLYVGWIQNEEEFKKYDNISKNFEWIFGHFEFKNVELINNLSLNGIDINYYYVMKEKFDNNNDKSNIISGHLHQRMKWKNVTYIGSPYPQTWHGKNKKDYGICFIDTKTKTIEYKDLNLFRFNEYSLKWLLENKNNIKDDIYNSENRIIVDCEIDDKDLNDLKIELNIMKPKSLSFNDEKIITNENIEYNKIQLSDPREFINDYIKNMKIENERKNRIFEKINGFLNEK